MSTTEETSRTGEETPAEAASVAETASARTSAYPDYLQLQTASATSTPAAAVSVAGSEVVDPYASLQQQWAGIIDRILLCRIDYTTSVTRIHILTRAHSRAYKRTHQHTRGRILIAMYQGYVMPMTPAVAPAFMGAAATTNVLYEAMKSAATAGTTWIQDQAAVPIASAAHDEEMTDATGAAEPSEAAAVQEVEPAAKKQKTDNTSASPVISVCHTYTRTHLYYSYPHIVFDSLFARPKAHQAGRDCRGYVLEGRVITPLL